ncbi:hypothetical protein J2W21_001993 [Sinomonas atrocyanea]|uniref:hypothetical protein n=1 Tax=Sinomonas atrocyanea TaxID=37927 RepID=UPI002786E3B5|nr:hypothetical protein [Sinomonas atrocyanea]MDP9884480.1 hypothetical protein [Sinomonas atrocyanea]
MAGAEESPTTGRDEGSQPRGGSTPKGSETRGSADPPSYGTAPAPERGYKYGSGTREGWSEAEEVEPGPEDDVL